MERVLEIESTLKISKRLKTVADFINTGEKIADIGSDHGYLACYVCLIDGSKSAIATELNNGPYESTKEMVDTLNLSQKIEVRLGNGFEPIVKGEVTTAVIAGMGGTLITSILNADIDKVKTVHKLILQPNIDEKEVRYWLYANSFKITDEAIIEEKGHIYEIIVAEQSENDELNYLSEEQYFFGPVLLEGKNEVFLKKWQQRYHKLKKIIQQIEKTQVNHKNIIQFKRELHWMEEFLKNDNKSADI